MQKREDNRQKSDQWQNLLPNRYVCKTSQIDCFNIQYNNLEKYMYIRHFSRPVTRNIFRGEFFHKKWVSIVGVSEGMLPWENFGIQVI